MSMMKAWAVRIVGPVLLALSAASELAAHHELADPADIFDKMDRPVVTATPTQAILAAVAILLIPIVIIVLVFWSRRSRES